MQIVISQAIRIPNQKHVTSHAISLAVDFFLFSFSIPHPMLCIAYRRAHQTYDLVVVYTNPLNRIHVVLHFGKLEISNCDIDISKLIGSAFEFGKI